MSEQPANDTAAQDTAAQDTAAQDTPVNAASHDAKLTERLTAFMATGWAPGDDPALLDPEPVTVYAAKRRAQLSAAFPGDVLVIPTGGAKVRSNDTDYPFRAGSDYAWLVGDLEPDGVLVMVPAGDGPNGGHSALVHIPERSDRTSTAFFTDRKYGELWVGPRRGPEEVARVFEVEAAGRGGLEELLSDFPAKRIRVVRGLDAGVDVLVTPPAPIPAPKEPLAEGEVAPVTRDAELDRTLAELRLVKDDWEIGELESAVAATVTGFEECVRDIPRARELSNGERWLEGTFWRRSRVEGNDVGYGSIVACGHHATTLHWTRDDGPITDGELMLLDMGVEGRSLYTADVTRTLPVSGTFTPEQRRVYDVVHAAQRAAIAVIAPGVDFADVHKTAMTVITEALVSWRLLEGDIETLVKDTMHRRWSLHGTSHHLGIDVHDCALAREERMRKGKLEAGMVITVEPGLYFQPNDTLAPAELRGIGVRIEDDVLVTADGSRVLSDALPTEAGEVEAWMRALLA